MYRGYGDDRGGNFLFQTARIQFAQPREFLRAAVYIDARDKVLVSAEHDRDHDQQSANQRHVDQRNHHQHQVGFTGAKHQREVMHQLRKKFQCKQYQRQ